MALVARVAGAEGPQVGLVVDDVVYALEGDLFSPESYRAGARIGPVGQVTLLPPVQPSKIVCVGRNYAAHAAEHAAAVPTEPMLFLKPPSALIGPGEPIEIPADAGRVDHEAELVIVIGKRARHVSEAAALGVVLGYTCADDVSARDYQKKDGQWGRAKGFDTFCPLGPWINTALDPSDLAVGCTVNGETRQDSRTSLMVFSVSVLIAFISRVMTLEPGDIILTGTPEGVSALADGDRVRVSVEGIGVLENPVHVVAR